jgi:hypothetical protein
MPLAQEGVGAGEVRRREGIENALPQAQISDPAQRNVDRTEPECMDTPKACSSMSLPRRARADSG